MHIFELCDHIKTKRGIGFFLDGEKSIKRLRSFLVGYQAGVGHQAGPDNWSEWKLTGADDMHNFNSWVAKELGFSNSTSGWCNMIISKVDSDEKAFDLFFELFDKYRKEREQTFQPMAETKS